MKVKRAFADIGRRRYRVSRWYPLPRRGVTINKEK